MNPERRLAFLWIFEYESRTFFARDVFNSSMVSIIKHVKTAMILRGFFSLLLTHEGLNPILPAISVILIFFLLFPPLDTLDDATNISCPYILSHFLTLNIVPVWFSGSSTSDNNAFKSYL